MSIDRDIEGLVVGGVDYGESDRVVYLLSREGRITVFAHGAKTSKRRFQGALEPFTTIRASLSHSKKKRTGMPTLTNAIVESPRLPLRRELKTIALASYVVELSAKVAPEAEPSIGIFELARDVLDHLCLEEATMAARRAFELRLMAEIGYRPELEYCVECGTRPARSFVDLVRGGLLCEEHQRRSASAEERSEAERRASGPQELGPHTLAWARAVLRSPAFSIEGGELDAEGRDRAAKKLTGPMARFFAQLLDRPLSSLALLEAERL